MSTELPLNSTLAQESSQPLSPSSRLQKRKAVEDLFEGLKKWRIWLLLAYQDIKLRYRRSVLGPLWITISMAITVYSMGFLYSHLFHMDLAIYFPFLASGMIAWSLLSNLVIDLTEAFSASEGLVKQIKLPYTIYIHRAIGRNLIIFLHNILVMIPLFIVFHQTLKINFHLLLLLLNLFLLYLNAFFYGIVFALIGARYRDVPQIIKSLIQVVFFITPVMWSPSVLPPKYQFAIDFNPFYAFIELIRMPLIGQMIHTSTIYMVTATTLIGFYIAYKMLVKNRARIIYWL